MPKEKVIGFIQKEDFSGIMTKINSNMLLLNLKIIMDLFGEIYLISEKQWNHAHKQISKKKIERQKTHRLKLACDIKKVIVVINAFRAYSG